MLDHPGRKSPPPPPLRRRGLPWPRCWQGRQGGTEAAPLAQRPHFFLSSVRESVQRPHAPRKAVRSGGSALNNQSNDKMSACLPPARPRPIDGAAKTEPREEDAINRCFGFTTVREEGGEGTRR